MKSYIIDKKEEIKEANVISRDVNLFETKSVALVVIGPRRAGKTYSLIDFIHKNKLKDEDYVFINFEDDLIFHMKREEKINLIKHHIEIYNKEPEYIFLDEIYALEDWEHLLYSLIEKHKYKIFITGSSSKLLSKEIATALRGRAFSKIVFPFSFKEYLKLLDFDVNMKLISTRKKAQILHHLSNYLSSSGFPQILIDKIHPTLFFRDYLDLVMFKDVMERYNVENIFALKHLLIKMISSFSKQFSINKVYNELKGLGIKIGKATLYDYAEYITDSLVAFFIKRFDFSEKTSELSIPKLYLADNGLANYILKTNFSENKGRLMENVVAIELKKKEFDSNVHIFYWKDYQQHEVDFVVKDGLKVKQLIQVTDASSKEEIKKGELRALLKASKELKCKDLLVITWDYEAEEDCIKFVPLWKWLLE